MNRLALAFSAFAIGTVSASAADLAARPYTKAPPPVVVAAYDWSGFYVGANGGGAWSRKCWDINPFTITTPRRLAPSTSPAPKAATPPAAPRPAARSAIAGRAPPGCSASKPRATGPI